MKNFRKKRKRILLFLAVAFLTLLGVIIQEQDKNARLNNTGFENSPLKYDIVKVVKVYDGDTLDVMEEDGTIKKVRLYGIDAPEKGQPYANAARKFLEKTTKGKSYFLQLKDIDKFDRHVAILYEKSWVSVQEELLKNGLVWFYPRFCKDFSICGSWDDMEDEAIKNHIGLWQDENPKSPWDFKHGQ